MNEVDVKIKLDEGAVLPSYKCEGDAGMDICASEDIVLYPGDTVKVPTGVYVELPPGYAFEVSPRSGISLKTKLRVTLGTIDSMYRGEIGIIVDNISQASLTEVVPLPVGEEWQQFIKITPDEAKELDEDIESDEEASEAYIEIRNSSDNDPDFNGAYIIKKGDRIAQLKLKEVPKCNWIISEELSDSERGTGGFGHTGV